MKITNYLKNKLRDSKKYMQYSGLFLLSSLFIGCNIKETKRELSEVLHEPAIVSETVYTPSRHGDGMGMGPTIDLDGNVGLAVTFVDVDVPEKYAAVFKCQHGKFVIQGTDKRHKNLWERLSEGDSVDITYREIYEVTRQDIDDDGKKDIINTKLIDYDFLDAQQIGEIK